MWGVERILFSEFLGGWEGMKERRKVVKHAIATTSSQESEKLELV